MLLHRVVLLINHRRVAMPQSKVVIIDDEPAICFSFWRVVEKQTAGTMADGLADCDPFAPDVVVRYLNLPNDSGVETFRALGPPLLCVEVVPRPTAVALQKFGKRLVA